MQICGYILFAFGLLSCTGPGNSKPAGAKTTIIKDDQPINAGENINSTGHIETGKTTPSELVTFASSLKGTTYKYGSTDPVQGFDCSGFITYVFNHFKIVVPRSSVDYTHVDKEIPLSQAKAGDLVLFTGTDSTIKVVGHMGIITSNTGEGITFIHSTSGTAYGVTETPLNTYYMGRYVKVLRIFPQNYK